MTTVHCPIDRGKILRFQEILGDPNPLHFDKKFAKRTRFKKPIVPAAYLFALSETSGSTLLGARKKFRFYGSVLYSDKEVYFDTNQEGKLEYHVAISKRSKRSKRIMEVETLEFKAPKMEGELRKYHEEEMTEAKIVELLDLAFDGDTSQLRVPMFYPAGLISTALYKMFSSIVDENMYGFYHRLIFDGHNRPKIGDIVSVHVGEIKKNDSKGLHVLESICMDQNEKPIVTARTTLLTVPFEKAA